MERRMMKYFKFSRLQPVLLSLGLFAASPAYAQPQVSATPRTMTVVGTRGIVETRTVFLRTDESITNLRVTAFDLFNADGTEVFPASSIRVSPPPKQANANDLLSFPVKFDLQNAPSGEFSGELLVRYQADELIIPVIVRVKDPWLLPFLTLLAGVGLSMAVSAYSTEGKLRDEITVSMIQLRTQIEEDKQGQEKAKPFWSRTNMYLEDAKVAHYTKQWEEAKKAVEEARKVWNKWYRNRTNWLLLIDYYEELKKRLEEPDLKNSEARYIQAIKRQLDDTFQRLPELTEPRELRQSLSELSDQINLYLGIDSQLDKLNNLSNQLEGERRYEWEDRVINLQEKLNILLPSAQTELDALKNEISEGITQLKKDLAAQPLQTLTETKSLSGMVLQPPPTSSSTNISTSKSIKTWLISTVSKVWPDADGRLRLFSITSYLIALTLLAGGGFKELYLSRPTFGSEGWSDYFTLLAWGFGAEATRSAVTKVVRNWELPGSK
jgi:hypothetical protein